MRRQAGARLIFEITCMWACTYVCEGVCMHIDNICDRAWENRSYLHILYFEKYEFEILNPLFFSCGAIQSRQIYYTNSVVI